MKRLKKSQILRKLTKDIDGAHQLREKAHMNGWRIVRDLANERYHTLIGVRDYINIHRI